MKNKIIAVVVLIVVAGGAFYFGAQSGKSGEAAAATAMRGNFARGMGANGVGVVRGAGAGAGGFVGGQIISKDTTSLTVGAPGGGSKIIFFSASTPVTKTVNETATDLTVGVNISVVGSANSDGSITAQSIQIRPAGFATTTRAMMGQ